MIRFILFLLARLAVGSVCLLTAAYATLNCSTFAFDMFIRPQLFPWITSFVNWHHIWSFGAFALSVPTLATAFGWRAANRGRQRWAFLSAVAYAVAVGACVARLFYSPLLPTLWGDWRSLPVAVAALVPLVWLSVIDHLVASPLNMRRRWSYRPAAGQGRLLLACTIAGGSIWAGHLVLAACSAPPSGDEVRVWLVTAVWTLALTAGASAVVYAVLGTKLAAAARSRRPWWWHHLLAVMLAALAISEFLRRAVLPTISVPPLPAATVAVMAGISLAALGAGLAVRRPLRRLSGRSTAPAAPPGGVSRWAAPAAALLALPWLTSGLPGLLAPWDWAFVGQRLLIICETACALTLAMRLARERAVHRNSPHLALVPPLAALALLVAVPHAALRMAGWTGDRRFEPASAFEQHAAAIPLFRFAADLLVARPGFDGEYYRFLQARAAGNTDPLSIPEMAFPTTASRAEGRRPDIYLFVIDSLRRDYLSPYNHAVTFTPSIEAFSHGSFVFGNAFTRHGATQLAAPSIWAGAAVVRGVLAPGFERLNALEAFVNAEGYRLAINDFTVASYLRSTTSATFLDPGIPSVDTDLCRNLDSLVAYLDGSASDSRPVLAYLSPMNLHILRTRGGGGRDSAGDSRGFYPPYVSALKRIDACFGNFVSALKARDRYDNSIIVLTSDHGDSLGENGYWGHATWLFPEVIRLPLVVHVPDALREMVTTDLSRLAFTSDLVPTLYALRGHRVDHIGQPYGAPLFVPKTCVVEDDRRRSSFLLTSSYGAAFGLLRRNGRQLYVTDLVERREFAYDLTRGPLGRPGQVSPEMRRLNERIIRQEVEAIEGFYRFRGPARNPAEGGKTGARASASSCGEGGF